MSPGKRHLRSSTTAQPPSQPVAGSPLERFGALLARPVSGASLAALRISMGLLMALEAWSLCRPNLAAISMGTSPIETYYAGSTFSFHLPYAALAWLPLLPTPWMYALAGLLGLAGILMALGFQSRASSLTVFLIWGYFFAVESTRSYWQSHYYLELLVTFLLVWMPAGRRFSIDAWLAGRRGRPLPHTVPFWTLFVLRGQLVIAYFYAGVAKLNWDWLADAIPVRWFLTDPATLKPYEAMLSPGQLEWLRNGLHAEWFAYFISYTGLAFDLVVGFLFLFRRSRVLALALMFIFHATNHFLIFDDIDWFPLAGASSALIFLDADWPGRVWAWLRKPRFGRPDWGWLVAGGLALPVVGTLLGWRIKERPLPAADAAERHRVSKRTVRLVALWLVMQTLLPLRHYLIAGDGRFTYEGLSFSWRLKSDRHSARGALLLVRDTAILPPASGGQRQRIDWSQWRGDRVIYRRVVPGRIDWRRLPELAVILHPIAGERVIYNPFAAGLEQASSAAVRERASSLWQTAFGRAPGKLLPTLPLESLCGEAATALRAAGLNDKADQFAELAPAGGALDQNSLEPPLAAQVRTRLRSMLLQALNDTSAHDAIAGLIHQLDPFVLEGQPRLPASFLVVDDPPLTAAGSGLQVDHDRLAAIAGFAAREPARYDDVGGPPLVIYTGDMGIEAGALLPQAYLMDFLGDPTQPVQIFWNSLKDLSPSKSIHISNQAFYLRRYARRVADLWEKEHGRRPAVNALTAVSLNGRPHQELVDPRADLARVTVNWFGHNPWIRDLEMKRIPREVVTRTMTP